MNLEKLNIDAYLVLGDENKRYVSDFRGSYCHIICMEDKGLFLTDGRYELESKNVKKKFEVKIIQAGSSPIEEIITYLKENNIKRLGFDPNMITLKEYEYYKEKLNFLELIGCPKAIEDSRLCKTEEEIGFIKKAVEITDATLSKTLTQIEEGMTEIELRNILDFNHMELGAEKLSFDSIVAFGENAALPHAKPTNRKLKKGDIITIDFGCFYKGYCSDMTRTFFFGEPKSEELVNIHNTVREAMDLQIAHVKAGVSTKEIDKIGRDYIDSKGYAGKFSHGTGHGIGLEIHEAPLLNKVSDIILQEGMTITIEPGIYIEGLGGVRIENDIVVKKDNGESLNKTDRSYDILNNLDK